MAKLTWSDPGEHFFEIGVDRGVLYVDDDPGVAWNGLISVDESPTGGDPTPYYLDGLMFLMVPTAEWFEATITAFNRPVEFAPCDGTSTGVNGMRVTAQRRRPFGLSYRTKIGNDQDGVDHGYLIHLIYNAMVGPSTRNHASMSADVNPTPYSWPVKAKPVSVPGYKPTWKMSSMAQTWFRPVFRRLRKYSSWALASSSLTTAMARSLSLDQIPWSSWSIPIHIPSPALR